MATIVANGNRSVISPAYADTDNGYFEHATAKGISNAMNRYSGRGGRGTYVPYSNGYNKSGPTNRAVAAKPKIYGENTVYVDGEPYPDSYWANQRVHPVEHPFIKGRWVHPDRVEELKKQYSYNKEVNRLSGFSNPERSAGQMGPSKLASIKSSIKAQSATKNAINSATDALKKVPGKLKNAPGNEISNIRSGAQAAMEEYDRTHGGKSSKPSDYADEPNATRLGRAMAGVRGGIGSSAVGRAGKAAFEALTNKFEDFKRGINKYLTGADAGKNRSDALSKLREQAGGLISAIGSALGTSEGRSGIVRGAASALGTVTGTAAGVAKGIASSNIGKAAINAGKTAYGAVKNGVGSALKSISNFFKSMDPRRRKRNATGTKDYGNGAIATVM